VCLQLYQETTGLGLRLNDLTFVDTRKYGSVSAYDHFGWFMRNCSSQQLGRIQRVTIIDESTRAYQPQPGYSLFVKVVNRLCVSSLLEHFCRNYPKAKVIVRLDWNYRVQDEYIICMYALSRILRGRPQFILPSNPATSQGFAGELPRYFSGGLPRNLRFSITKNFSEEHAQRGLSVFYPGGVPRWEVKMARWRHDNGL
jgi:hypothetical protein